MREWTNFVHLNGQSALCSVVVLKKVPLSKCNFTSIQCILSSSSSSSAFSQCASSPSSPSSSCSSCSSCSPSSSLYPAHHPSAVCLSVVLVFIESTIIYFSLSLSLSILTKPPARAKGFLFLLHFNCTHTQ